MIDWDKVAELREDVGAEDFDAVVELFLEEVDASIGALAPGSDARTLETGLHFIKGSALNLGFDTLSRLCQEGERDAAEGRAEAVDIAALAASYAAARAAFVQGLPVRFRPGTPKASRRA